MPPSEITTFAAARVSFASSPSQTTKASRQPRNSGECVKRLAPPHPLPPGFPVLPPVFFYFPEVSRESRVLLSSQADMCRGFILHTSFSVFSIFYYSAVLISHASCSVVQLPFFFCAMCN